MIPDDNSNQKKGVIAWFARNSVAANLLMLVIVFGGIIAATSINRQMQPDFEINVIEIIVPYPGASPSEVEQGVVLKIEEALSDIEAIESLEATSRESVATLRAEIYSGRDNLAVMDEIKSAIDGISSFPEEIERPIVNQVKFDKHALQLQVSGDLDERSMKLLADSMKQEMLQNPNIAMVKVNGGREFEIAIEVSEATLIKHGLTLGDVADAVRRSSLDIPAGAIKTRNGEILLRTKGQARRQQEFENIVLLSSADGVRLTLGDIAVIKDAFVETDAFSYFDGQSSIGLQVLAVEDQDLVKVAEAAKHYAAQKQAQLPEGVSVDVWADATFYLNGRIDMMIKNLGAGALLVFVVLGLFLNIKLAFWVMVGLPICFLGTFAVMPYVDVTINMMSLFGFILVLGIVVDDAIIIGESAYSESERYGHSLNSITDGALKVATPATFGVLTTIAAFMPTLFSNGAFAPFPEAIGWVVIACLAFSLVESKWILPSHLAHSPPGTGGFWLKLDTIPRYFNEKLTYFVEQRYRPLMLRAIEHRVVTAAIFIGLLIVTAGLVLGGIVRFVMLPQVPADFMQANLEMVEGTPEEETRQAYEKMLAALQRTDQDYVDAHADDSEKHLVKHISAYGFDGLKVHFMVELSKNEQRDIDGTEIARRWREAIGSIPGAKILAIHFTDPGAGPAISFKLSGNKWQELEQAAGEIETALGRYSGVYDIRNGASTERDEIVLETKSSAQNVGLSPATIGQQVRDAFYGAEAQRVQRGNDEIKVMVRYPREQRESVSSLQSMYVRSQEGHFVPLSSVARLNVEPSQDKLTRIDSEPAITVSAQADKDAVEPNKITGEIMDGLIPQLKQKFPSLKAHLSGESEEFSLMLNSLFVGFGMSLFGIFGLLAIPLRSYAQPLIIMSVIPFGIIGAIVGHMIVGVAFSMMSFFGVIALSGVVVNDSLIMVDFINNARAQGEKLLDAVVNAGCQRFRAILLTSLTTFFGLLPMLLETSLQAQMVIPMAVSLAFGIIFATVITLILIPCLYIMLEDIGRAMSSRKAARESQLQRA